MDNISVLTYVTIDGYVDMDKYRYLYFAIMLTVYILVICSNSLIIYIIWMRPNLHEPMYIFIAALCVNSLIYSTMIYPKLFIDFLSETQVMSYPVCLFQWFIFYFLGGAEYFILAVMAYDRYVSICKPLQYPTIMKKTNVRIFIAFAWVIPFCHTVAPVFINAKKKLCHFVIKGIICNSTIHKLLCVASTALTVYGLVVFVNLLIFPLVFILYTYSRIFVITRRSKEMRRKAVETCLPHLLVLTNLTIFGTYDVLLLRIETEVSNTVRFIVTLQVIMYHPLFNPLIYGLKMKEINKHIKKLLSQVNK